MAKASSKGRALGQLTVPTKVEFRQPEFEPLGSLSALDFTRLSKGNHKIEIGFIKGGCCRNLVRAVVRNGLVTGCEVAPCEGSSVKAPKELLRLAARAHRKISTARRKWKPIPVKELVASNTAMLGLIIWGGGCILICAWGYCIMCCWWPRPHCFVPDIYTGPLSTR